MVYILLADGFEELEALAPCNMLRRAGVETRNYMSRALTA